MKKSGTPTFDGPGVASEKLGLVGAGLPSSWVSVGTGTTVAAGLSGSGLGHSRVEGDPEETPRSPPGQMRGWRVFGLARRAARLWRGVGVAVAVAVGAGGATVV